MKIDRREFVTAVAASGVAAMAPGSILGTEETPMYGLIGKIKAAPGKRAELMTILVEGVAGMPGCLSYVVAEDSTDADALWVTEVWDSSESHQASLTLESVQQAIAKGRPLIAGFEERIETVPIGGHGLTPTP